MKPALLVLEDGAFFRGEALGYSGETIGEVVFNTSMSGYQEILTDPSYRGQIITMTSNHIGNYGVNELDVESDGVQVAGFVVRNCSRRASNYRATATLEQYLIDSKTVGITGVDTRALTRHIRDKGAVMGAIVHGASEADIPGILERIKGAPRYEELDYVSECSVKAPSRVILDETGDHYAPHHVRIVGENVEWPAALADKPEVCVLDFGVKHSILRMLAETGVRVTVLPYNTTAEAILKRAPAGVLLSNGPGDPALLDGPINEIRKLIGQVPLFGICLGHQLLGLALGGESWKMKFGHRGPNQPVVDHDTGRVEITSQNHGFAVRFNDEPEGVEITHLNLNDQTVEGLRVSGKNAFSIQHHPEAGPGPRDAAPIFDRFRSMLGD